MDAIAVLASGKGSNLVALLDAIEAGHVDARVALVVSDRPGAPCLDVATSRAVPAIVELPAEPGEARESYDARLGKLLADAGVDWIVLAGFMRILGPGLVTQFSGRMINIHPSLLPSHRGAHGIRDALCSGVKVTGCTTHIVTPELDDGPILLQAAVPVRPDDDEARLTARVQDAEHALLPATVSLLVQGRISLRDGCAVIGPGPRWPWPEGDVLWPAEG